MSEKRKKNIAKVRSLFIKMGEGVEVRNHWVGVEGVTWVRRKI